MITETFIHGFQIHKIRPINELHADLYDMEHKKSGARLLWLDRADDNKTFAITFPTHPKNDTGVFHILEHSVLNGSKRYPAREPFVELMKGSLHTFLNAMTFPDKTMYPISSRNHQDFINLIRVYMDAVLHPAIYERPEIFRQEGWHYEFDETGIPSYKGVVFSEMKGMYTSPDYLLQNEVFRRLFPDNCYRYVSGGDPEHIPELSYEQFLDTHRTFYHPSNACIFLDGQIAIEQILKILDEEYLCEYERGPRTPRIPMQRPVDGGLGEITFELSEEESLEDRGRLAAGYVFGTYADREKIIAMQILSDVICGDNRAPLTNRLLDAGLAKNVKIHVEANVLQPFAFLETTDVDLERQEEICQVIREELTRLSKNGLDQKRLSSTLNNFEFQMLEKDYDRIPKGIIFAMNVMDSCLHGGDPSANLVIGDVFINLRKKRREGYFESLIENVFLSNPHTCQIIMRPTHTLTKERTKREHTRLLSARSSWNNDTLHLLKQQQEQLTHWQSTPDSSDMLLTIPVLKLSDIPQEAPILPTIHKTIGKTDLLYHAVPTEGITYLNLYFALDDLQEEELSTVSCLCGLIGNLDTEEHSSSELQSLLRTLCGSLSFSIDTFSSITGHPEEYRACLHVSMSTLSSRMEQATVFLSELLTKTEFRDSKRILELLQQRRTFLNQQILSNGNRYALNRTSAYSSAKGVAQEWCGGITFYQWLKRLEKNFGTDSENFLSRIRQYYHSLFCISRMTVSITAPEDIDTAISLKVFQNTLPEGTFIRPDTALVRPWGIRHEGILIPSDTAFAVSGTNLALHNAAYSGKFTVLSRIISLAYLWNAVRMQGGAYGCGMTADPSGFTGYNSFRDPNPARTLGCYKQSSAFLADFLAQEPDLTSFIIGTVAQNHPLLTPRMIGLTADSYYWQGITQEGCNRTFREILSTTPQDLQNLIEVLDSISNQSGICILGSGQQLDNCSSYLEHIAPL